MSDPSITPAPSVPVVKDATISAALSASAQPPGVQAERLDSKIDRLIKVLCRADEIYEGDLTCALRDVLNGLADVGDAQTDARCMAQFVKEAITHAESVRSELADLRAQLDAAQAERDDLRRRLWEAVGHVRCLIHLHDHGVEASCGRHVMNNATTWITTEQQRGDAGEAKS